MTYNNFLQKRYNISLPTWSVALPILSVIVLLLANVLDSSVVFSLAMGATLISVVLSAVHQAEVVAHKVGEPFGTLILALAITIIEVSLIVSIMVSDKTGGSETLARDTVFAAIMIILTGIIGICLLVGGYKHKVQIFVKEGVSAALIALTAITILTLVLPNYTTTEDGPAFAGNQLIFIAIMSLVLYLGFVGVQTGRHRDYFLPEDKSSAESEDVHALPPNNLTTTISLITLLVALGAVVLLSKKLSPDIENIVFTLGAPKSLVGIIIATVILLPEGMAALRAARNNRLQTSLNLALGSALASIGLTIPAVAIMAEFTGMNVILGIDAKSMLLMVTSLFTIAVAFSAGRTNILQGIVLLVLFATYLFTTIIP